MRSAAAVDQFPLRPLRSVAWIIIISCLDVVITSDASLRHLHLSANMLKPFSSTHLHTPLRWLLLASSAVTVPPPLCLWATLTMVRSFCCTHLRAPPGSCCCCCCCCCCSVGSTSTVLVGDPDQLAPIGPGRPFAAVLAAGAVA
jgi:hypothetical protein